MVQLNQCHSRQHDMTASAETAQHHTLESQKHDLAAIQVLKSKLNVAQHWTLNCVEWQQATERVSMQRYQHCIDTLEGLISTRMFELTKMNMSQTGKSPGILSYTSLWLLSRLQHVQAYCQCPESSLESHPHCPQQVQCCCSHPSTSSTTPWLGTGGWVCLSLWLQPPSRYMARHLQQTIGNPSCSSRYGPIFQALPCQGGDQMAKHWDLTVHHLHAWWGCLPLAEGVQCCAVQPSPCPSDCHPPLGMRVLQCAPYKYLAQDLPSERIYWHTRTWYSPWGDNPCHSQGAATTADGCWWTPASST